MVTGWDAVWRATGAGIPGAGKKHTSRKNDEEEERRDLRNVRSQSVSDRFLQIVEDKTTLFNSSDDGGEVVVKQDHVSSFFRYVRSTNSHSNT